MRAGLLLYRNSLQSSASVSGSPYDASPGAHTIRRGVTRRRAHSFSGALPDTAPLSSTPLSPFGLVYNSLFQRVLPLSALSANKVRQTAGPRDRGRSLAVVDSQCVATCAALLTPSPLSCNKFTGESWIACASDND